MLCNSRKSVALEAIKDNNSDKNRFIKIIFFGSNEQDLEIFYNGIPP